MIHKHYFEAFNCRMMAAVDMEGRPEILDQVPGWFEEWESALSRFRQHSELNAVNSTSGQPVRVSDIFAAVFESALNAYRASDRLVTPLILNAILQAGYNRSFDLLNAGNSLQTFDVIGTALDLENIEWDARFHTLHTPDGYQLDFGGVAKGWAAHQAAIRLSKIAPALVDAAGDIAVSGPGQNDQPWLIGIADPDNPDRNLGLIQIRKGGVATSGTDRRRWLHNGVLNHHIIDPRSGLPAGTDVLTATVVAPSIMNAEMASKTILILGSEQGLLWLEKKHPQMAAFIILESRDCIWNANMNTYFRGSNGITKI